MLTNAGPTLARARRATLHLEGTVVWLEERVLIWHSASGSRSPVRAGDAATGQGDGWTTVDATGRAAANAAGRGPLRTARSLLHKV
jgi:hypothetical protein